MARADVLLVSLGGTAGLREADLELAASLRRAGAEVVEAAAERPREWRTYALLELAWARAARAAAAEAIHEHHPRAVLYSSTTAALLAPHPGAIRFDAPAAGNRPGRRSWCRCQWRRAARPAGVTSRRSPTGPTRKRRGWTAYWRLGKPQGIRAKNWWW